MEKHRGPTEGIVIFRQLKRRDFLDYESGKQQGVPWGLVNYFWPGCDDRIAYVGHHLHLVWQDGQELYRDCVYPEGKGQALHCDAQMTARIADLMAFLAIHTAPSEFLMEPTNDGRYQVWRKEDRSGTQILPKELNFHCRWDDRSFLEGTIEQVPLIHWRFSPDWFSERRRARGDYYDDYHGHFRMALRITLRDWWEYDYQGLADMHAREIWKENLKLRNQARDLAAKADKLTEQWDRQYQALARLDQLSLLPN